MTTFQREDNVVEATIQLGKCVANDVEYTIPKNTSGNTVYIGLFSRNDEGDENFVGRLFYLKNYDNNGNLKNHFVAAYDTIDHRYGMYDKVTETFWGSSNNIEFECG